MTDIFDRYPQFRGKPAEMAMMCALLRDRGQYDDALALGAAAVSAASGDTGIRSAVTAALSSGVPRFHIPMMLDDARNQAYTRAIGRLVKPGMTVLEIGTGAGLLALLAARAGARVVTCEANPGVAAAAAAIIARNGLSDRITLVRKRSTDLTVPGDLPEPADLVMHEIFGSTLFDEGVTAALTDARRRLLKRGAPSIPPRAHVRCAAVRTPEPHARARLDAVEGFDLSMFELLGQPARRLTGTERRATEQVSDMVTGLAMDYNGVPPFGPASESLAVASRGGRIDGILQWIGIEFDDGHLLHNDPFVEGPASSWGVPYVPLVTPIQTIPGQPLEVKMRHRGNLLVVDVTAGPPR